MPSEDDAPIISRFKASCTRLPTRFRWPELFANRLGLQTLYLADLDAIEGRPPRLDIVREIVASGFHLWIDAGARDVSVHCSSARARSGRRDDRRRP